MEPPMSNVQKAADLLQEHFPSITVMQGVEHTVATIIGKWIGLRPIKDLCQLSKKMSIILCVIYSFELTINLLFTII